MPLPLQESEEARRSKLLLRPVFRLEHSVGVENAAISGPEGKFQRTVRGVFRKAEQQAVRIDFSKRDLFSIQCSHDEWRMTRPGVAENLPFRIQEQVARGDEMFLEFPAERAIQSRQHLRSEEHTSELQSHHDLVCRLL